jgi:Zn-finger nucleic acid-binding protein
MKCPACFNELSQVQVGSLTVDVCQGGCGGIWFDAFELQRVDEEEETAGEQLLQIDRDPQVKVDSTRKRECPKCPGVKLQRHYFSAQRRVEVDECPNCAGYWLDAGELAQIRAEKAHSAQEQQSNRTQLTPEVIRYLYRLKTEARKTP